MAGTIYEKRPGRFMAKVFSHTDPSTKRSVYRERRIHGTTIKARDRELRLFVAEVEASVEGLRLPARSTAAPLRSSTFENLLDRWLAYASDSLEILTIKSYTVCKRRVARDLGALKVSEVTVPVLDRLYRELLAENIGTPDKPRHRTAKTVHRHHAVIRLALGQAVAWGELPYNPAVSASPPKVHDLKITPPTAEVAQSLMVTLYAKDAIVGTLVVLAAASGARRGELCGLKWSRVDLDDGTITIDAAIVEDGRRLVAKSTKTRGTRVVGLDASTIAALRTHRTASKERALAVGRTLGPDAYVFTLDPSGVKAMKPDHVTKVWTAHCKREGHAGVRLHDLRHYMATEWIRAGVPITEVSERLGHAQVSTTLNVYAHARGDGQRAAVEFMADKLPKFNLGQ